MPVLLSWPESLVWSSRVTACGQLKLGDGIYPSPNALIRESCGRCSVFNLRTGRVYGLDEVASRMLTVLIEARSIPAAHQILVREYDVDPAVLSSDLLHLFRQLLDDDIVGAAA
jgi:hypothetical protein